MSPGAERGWLHHPRWDVDTVGCSHGAMQAGFLQGCVSCNKSRVSSCVWSSCRFYFVPSMFPAVIHLWAAPCLPMPATSQALWNLASLPVPASDMLGQKM